MVERTAGTPALGRRRRPARRRPARPIEELRRLYDSISGCSGRPRARIGSRSTTELREESPSGSQPRLRDELDGVRLGRGREPRRAGGRRGAIDPVVLDELGPDEPSSSKRRLPDRLARRGRRRPRRRARDHPAAPATIGFRPTASTPGRPTPAVDQVIPRHPEDRRARGAVRRRTRNAAFTVGEERSTHRPALSSSSPRGRSAPRPPSRRTRRLSAPGPVRCSRRWGWESFPVADAARDGDDRADTSRSEPLVARPSPGPPTTTQPASSRSAGEPTRRSQTSATLSKAARTGEARLMEDAQTTSSATIRAFGSWLGMSLAHIDELDRIEMPDGFVWRPVRRRFCIRAFGVNAYSAAEPGAPIVEEHTESSSATRRSTSCSVACAVHRRRQRARTRLPGSSSSCATALQAGRDRGRR